MGNPNMAIPHAFDFCDSLVTWAPSSVLKTPMDLLSYGKHLP